MQEIHGLCAPENNEYPSAQYYYMLLHRIHDLRSELVRLSRILLHTGFPVLQ